MDGLHAGLSDRPATRAIAVSFAVLAAYVGVESTRDLFGDARPDVSAVGIVLAPLVAGPDARAGSGQAPARAGVGLGRASPTPSRRTCAR